MSHRITCPGTKPGSMTIATAYEAWDEVERLGRNNKKIVDIKDHPVTPDRTRKSGRTVWKNGRGGFARLGNYLILGGRHLWINQPHFDPLTTQRSPCRAAADQFVEPSSLGLRLPRVELKVGVTLELNET